MGRLHANTEEHEWRGLDARVSPGTSLVEYPVGSGIESAEAELNAIVKSMTEILGLMNMMKECDRVPKGRIFTDSSAANGIVHRQGCGKVKHLECRQLWVQAVVGDGRVACTKVPRAINPADALTHDWSNEDGRRHFEKINVLNPDAKAAKR